jgi:uncharacterized protein (TIGR00251 family)
MNEELLKEIEELPHYIKVKAVPNAPKTYIKEKMADGAWKIYIQAIPDKNKANLELKKFFKKSLGFEIEIISGDKDRTKLIKIYEKN